MYYDGVHHTDISIRTAVTAWFNDATAAEATYGHISTWKTGKVTDMSSLFCAESGEDDCNTAAASFNEDIGAWDTSGVTTMNWMFGEASSFNQPIGGWNVEKVVDARYLFERASAFNQFLGSWSLDSVTRMYKMFYDASAFDQDLGWCVEAAFGKSTFKGTKCEATSCGVAQKDVIGICEPWARPCLISNVRGHCIINTPTLIMIILLVLLAGAGLYVRCKKKKDETYAAAARRVLCCRGTKVRAVAPTTSEEAPALPASVVSVVDAPAAGIAPNELGTVVSVEQPPANQR